MLITLNNFNDKRLACSIETKAYGNKFFLTSGAQFIALLILVIDIIQSRSNLYIILTGLSSLSLKLNN